MIRGRRGANRFALSAPLLAALASAGAAGAPYVETPSLAEMVASGELPAVEHRLPARPSVVALTGDGLAPGRHGGELRLLMGRAKDVRLMVVYGYARLVGYDPDFRLAPDLLEDVEVEEGRVFTLRLRPGHRWSDGRAFTSEDFRYYWEDIATNEVTRSVRPAPRVSRRGRATALRGAGRAHRALHVVAAQPVLPAGAGRRAAGVAVRGRSHYLKCVSRPTTPTKQR